MLHDRRDVVGTEPVDDRAVALAAGEAQHAGPERGDEERRHLVDRGAEAEALDRERLVVGRDLLARERGAEEPERVTDALVGLLERDAVPVLDDDVRRRADAEGEPTGRGGAHRGDRLGERRGTARVQAGTIAVPSRSVGVHAAASASGVNASKLPDSADQRSV